MPIFLKRMVGSAVALKRYNFPTLGYRLSLFALLTVGCISLIEMPLDVYNSSENVQVTIKKEEQKAEVESSVHTSYKRTSVNEGEMLLRAIKQEKLSKPPATTVNRAGQVERADLTSRSAGLASNRRKEPVVVASNQLQKLEAVSVVATGYTAGVESTGKSPEHPSYGITKSGIQVHRDARAISTVAADPKVFPIGTLLYIPDYGYGIVADTGSAIKGKKIDLYYDTVHDVYKQWGKKELDVYVIQKGDGKLSKEMFNHWKQQVGGVTV